MEVRVVGDALAVMLDKDLQRLAVHSVLTDTLLLPTRFVDSLFHEQRVFIGNHRAGPDDISAGKRMWLRGGIEDRDRDQRVIVRNGAEQSAGSVSSDVQILFEDEHLLVANKPAGLLVHREGSTSNVPDLDSQICQYLYDTGQQGRLRHVHRLDVGTSGAILYAKHDYIARALDSMLFHRHITRRYIAAVQGWMQAATGTFNDPIGRHRHVAGRYRVSATGKPAVTHYQVLSQATVGNTGVSIVGCSLDTGRTHQIRVHFQNAGHPVVGDVLYGGGDGIGGQRWSQGFALHAVMLSFQHPYTRAMVDVLAPVPQAWTALDEYMNFKETIDRYCVMLMEKGNG